MQMEDFTRKVRVLVLGDMGCSPRMRNHCLSFANSGWEVFFSGYLQTELPSQLSSNKMIKIDPIKKVSQFFEKRKKMKFFLILKVLLTAFYLLSHLLFCEWTNVLIIQNPPALPTFIVAWFISKMRQIKLIIDWHNYGHTIMDAESPNNGFLNRLYKYVELKLPKRFCAINLCVSKALKNDLLLKWNISSSVLYDLPWRINSDRDLTVFHNLFLKLGKDYPQFIDENDDSKTVLTEVLTDGLHRFKENRPVIIISSCSWTIDDDFETLFKALDMYNELIIGGARLPDIFCIITGKGPLKSYFQRLVSEQNWPHITVVMPWLEPADYPIALGAADLGICLHKSTSGLDLPMKVVDMFSVGLPVLALNYRCLHELVEDRWNGRLFSSTEGLCKHLVDLLVSVHSDRAGGEPRCDDLEQYRDNVVNGSRHGLWQEEWERVVLPLLEDLPNAAKKSQ